MSKIGIIGNTKIGEKFRAFLSDHHEIITYDIWSQEKEIVFGVDIAIISIQAPPIKQTLSKKQQTKDLRCDTKLIEEVLEWCDAKIIVLASPLEPGTTERFKQIYNKNIVYCVWEEDFFILGGERQETRKIVDLFVKIAGCDKNYIQTDAFSAEFAKYSKDAFEASQIAFTNEIIRICEKTNLDYNVIREFLILSKMNKCYSLKQKINTDTVKSFLAYSDSIGHNSDLLKQIIDSAGNK